MPLPAPIIDDRRFADIVRDAKQLVPTYTPEWTDLNESDPGVTLVELFAWMTDMLIFRLNEVPDLHYVKFLELLGITLRPAEPAHADLTFSLVDPPTAPLVQVPKGTRVAAAGGDQPVVFETDRSLQALGAKLVSVLSFDGFSYTSVTTANAAGDRELDPFGPYARRDSALLLGFDYGGPFPSLALDLAVFAVTPPPELGMTCELAESSIAAPAQLAWEYWDGPQKQWNPLPVDRDETRAFTRSGYVTLRIPGDRMGKLALGDDVPDPLYWVRGRVSRAGYERAPKVNAVLPNTVPATQAQTVEFEVLGGSDGLPTQQFQLFYSPVLAGTLELEIDEGTGFERWQEVDDFLGSGVDDRHYVLDRATGTVTLPDGERGHIPVVNTSNPHANVRARAYRYGGGRPGDVAAGTVTQLQTAVDGIDSVTNRRPAEGGSEAETVEQAKARAAEQLQSKDRAVTASDFATIARSTPGTVIRRAETLPLTHPGFPDVEVPGAVTVVVIPDSPGPAPLPSEATLRNVCACLTQHRLLTTEVFVIGPTYRRIRVEAKVRAHTSADVGTVRAAVDSALNTYFHPLTGGDDKSGWPLGGTIFYSLVSKQILEADPGVARIDELWIFLDGDRQSFCTDVALRKRDLLASDQHDIQVSYE